MFKKLFCIPLFISCLSAQMITSSGVSAYELVKNTMAGHGIDVLWVTSQGGPTSFGPFTGSGSTFGFDDGIVLTTGSVLWDHGPVGPNDDSNAGIDNGTIGYYLLSAMAPSLAGYNGTAFEISFIPSGDSIFLEFVFGSEEYKEYLASTTSDMFGAFLTGLSPLGGWNLDQNIYFMTIDSINHLYHSNLYVDNEDPIAGSYTQYDGYTVPLTIRTAVVPNTNYVLKIAIADAYDGAYDSGVFIKAHSFTSGEYIGIDEELVNDFMIYPNPVDHFLQIQSKTDLPVNSVIITDALGRIVIDKNIASVSTVVDVSTLASGMYMTTIITSEGKFTKKIFVQ